LAANDADLAAMERSLGNVLEKHDAIIHVWNSHAHGDLLTKGMPKKRDAEVAPWRSKLRTRNRE
jgi:hypothetical protein